MPTDEVAPPDPSQLPAASASVVEALDAIDTVLMTIAALKSEEVRLLVRVVDILERISTRWEP